METERRRTVHGGKNSALCVEVSAWRHETNDSIVTCNLYPEDAHGFGVYIRNPMALHVRDFTGSDHEPWLGEEIAREKAAAFKWARTLADHLGCEVESQLKEDA